MEAPDFDELEWMAQQEECPYDDQSEETYEIDNGETVETLKQPDLHQFTGPQIVKPPVEECRKRSIPDDSEAESNKRAKTGDSGKVADTKVSEQVRDEWFQPMEEHWSPPPPSTLNDSMTEVPEANPDQNMKLPSRRLADIDGDFMPITNPAGDRVYAKVTKNQVFSKEFQNIHGSSKHTKHGLLSEPFDVLLQQIEQEGIRQACMIAEEFDTMENGTTDSPKNEQLWVEKYSPKSFTELLSDEQTNREVLRWLKQWDKCVFGEKQTSTSHDVFAALKRHTSGQSYRGGFVVKHGPGFDSRNINKNPKNSNHSSNYAAPINSKPEMKESKLDRPAEKILLLCGPPGLGKTTLAHVAAKHCGYRVVEINASDDRVAATLQAKILDAIQMKSVMGDMRPNCVVIDEIDGALGGADGKGAIDALLKIAYADVKEAVGKENEIDAGNAKKGSKKKSSSSTNRLSRPVICICNDPYAPALRQLRQMAKVHVFTPPSANRVVTRLKHICNSENYKMNARALTALAEHTECDIRSCLNTLQFLKMKKETLNTLDIGSQLVGRKDMTSSAFDIWVEILQKRKPKGISRASSGSSGGYGQEQKEFLRLHDLFGNHGEFELIYDGIYENLPNVRYHDSSLEKTVKCLELLGESEITSYHALRHQHFILNAYQPCFAIAIRRLLAQPEKPYLDWPKTSQRYRTEHAAKVELLKSWVTSMQPSTQRYFVVKCLPCDLVSPLLHILCPPKLRPVASQLLSQNEKDEMDQLVDTMISYGINYKTPKHGISGESFIESNGLIFDPPIHRLVHFKDYKSDYRLLSLTLRQVLSHEIELEKIRRESSARAARAMAIASDVQVLSLSQESVVKHENLANTNGKIDSLQGSKKQPDKTSKNEVVIRETNMKLAKKTPVNYFAQFRRTSGKTGIANEDTKNATALSQRDSRPIFFKFNEGFTNAIRRSMLVRDFF